VTEMRGRIAVVIVFIMLPHAILAQSIMRHRIERLRFPYQR
jgi:hypothetical protein